MRVENLKSIKALSPGDEFRTVTDSPNAKYRMKGPINKGGPGREPGGYNTIEGTWLTGTSMVWHITEEPDPIPKELTNIKLIKDTQDGK